MRKLNSKLFTNFISEKGHDSIHKTYVAYTPLDEFICFAVAESYDNDTEINSAKIAVETVLSEFEKKPSFKRLKKYLKCANEQILLQSTKYKRKVSITVILSDYTRMKYAVCGNTKIHVYFGNIFSHISKTQTKHQELLEDEKIIYKDPFETHNLIQYLGIGKHIKPFLSKKIMLNDNSSILISTSNLWGLVSDIELLDAFENAKNNQELLESIEELLLSKQEAEKIGSYTAAAITVEKTFKEDNTKKKKRKKILIIVAVILTVALIIGAIVISSVRASDRKKISNLKELNQKGISYIEYENYAKALDIYEDASERAEKLSLTNWQYIDEKKKLKDAVANKLAILTTLEDGETSIKESDYDTAKRLYTQVKEQAQYNEETELYEYACERLKLINQMLAVKQLIAVGDMYISTEDYKAAIKAYEEAVEMLKVIDEVELRGEVQVKIYDAIQKQKEADEKAKTEKEAKAKAKADKKLIKIKAYITTANKLLGDNNISGASELYDKIMELYEKIGISDEDTDKAYEEIVALEQAITEAKEKKKETAEKEEETKKEEAEKKEEEEKENKLKKAQKYMITAAEQARKGNNKKALAYYEKALAIYKELDIWDDQVDKIYEAIEELEQGTIETSSLNEKD